MYAALGCLPHKKQNNMTREKKMYTYKINFMILRRNKDYIGGGGGGISSSTSYILQVENEFGIIFLIIENDDDAFSLLF